MNRIPGILFIVLILFLLLRYLPRYWKGSVKMIRFFAFPLYLLGILYLTLFSRFLSPRKIYNAIFNMGYTPTETVIVGNRGSEWLAGKQGVTGIRLLMVGLSDPNSKLYIIPSCLMNLLLFVPLGMLFSFVLVNEESDGNLSSMDRETAKKSDRFWLLICSIFVLIIECIQYFFGLGQFDLLDVIFNSLGFFIGRKVYDRFIKGWNHE